MGRDESVANGYAHFGRSSVAARGQGGVQSQSFVNTCIEMVCVRSQGPRITNIEMADFFTDTICVLGMEAQLAEETNQGGRRWFTATISNLNTNFIGSPQTFPPRWQAGCPRPAWPSFRS